MQCKTDNCVFYIVAVSKCVHFPLCLDFGVSSLKPYWLSCVRFLSLSSLLCQTEFKVCFNLVTLFLKFSDWVWAVVRGSDSGKHCFQDAFYNCLTNFAFHILMLYFSHLKSVIVIQCHSCYHHSTIKHIFLLYFLHFLNFLSKIPYPHSFLQIT